MGVSGRYVKTFAEANLASAINVHMNADYPHFFFDVLGVEGKNVKLKSHWDSTEFTLPIKRNRSGQFVVLQQVSTYERLFQGGKPADIRFQPMQGERI